MVWVADEAGISWRSSLASHKSCIVEHNPCACIIITDSSRYAQVLCIFWALTSKAPPEIYSLRLVSSKRLYEFGRSYITLPRTIIGSVSGYFWLYVLHRLSPMELSSHAESSQH